MPFLICPIKWPSFSSKKETATVNPYIPKKLDVKIEDKNDQNYQALSENIYRQTNFLNIYNMEDAVLSELKTRVLWVSNNNLFGLRQCLHDINDKNMKEVLDCFTSMPVQYNELKSIFEIAYTFQNELRFLSEDNRNEKIFNLSLYIRNSLACVTNILNNQDLDDDQKKDIQIVADKLNRMSDIEYYSSMTRIITDKDVPTYIKPCRSTASFVPIICIPVIQDLFWTLFSNMKQHSGLSSEEQSLYWFQSDANSNNDDMYLYIYDKGSGVPLHCFEQMCLNLKNVDSGNGNSSPNRKKEGLTLSLQQLGSYSPVVFSRNEGNECLSDELLKNSFNFPLFFESGCGVRLTVKKIAYAIKHPEFPKSLQGETLNVLFIEDSIASRKGIIRKFKNKINPSWNVFFAEDKESLDAQMQGSSVFHVYIVDSNIPDMVGDVLKVCFDNDTLKSINNGGPIIISTTASEDESISLKKAGTAGIDVPVYGKKPNDIFTCVNTLLSERYLVK